MAEQQTISEKSRRVAKNTVLLYFRMLLLMVIGLFTSRLVMQNLGVESYGTYNAVAGLVSLFSIVVNGLSAAITRFLTCETGKGESGRVREMFASSLSILLVFSAVVVILIETLGLWLLNTRMDIPAESMEAAHLVLHCTAATMVFTLLSIPYTSIILANEQMKAYAWISILEAVLKITVAASLCLTAGDKLKVYASLMLGTAVVVRMTYAAYCRRHFEQTRTRPLWDKSAIGEMFGFAGWNVASSGIFMINTQGLNLLTNIFFGVAANAARGVAVQIEGIVKQFVNNVIVAINPQITKSYAAGDTGYSFTLVSKGAKYAYLILLCFIAPALTEMQTVLELWLGIVPEQAALFCKLTLICTLLDLLMTTFSTVILADGRIKGYYIGICAITVLIFPATWIAFRLGAPVYASYIAFISAYVVLDIVKLVILHKVTGYPYASFVKDVLARVAVPTIVTLAACIAVTVIIREASVERMLVTAAVSCAAFALSSYHFALTPGERAFVKSKLHLK